MFFFVRRVGVGERLDNRLNIYLFNILIECLLCVNCWDYKDE